ncbi:MAG: hypothetical protein A2571_00415 [Candidatus Vogelbacteria bacterium RIFOXYD1_FULL_44_32]|uniref:Uncharacterized protein n=1 Tax=Candidatus Vogelbacteria bacterium RIFOXYD1_FULL_44_32 TaxID=1802438 RepID=A0A1G2QE03_9BACT|nr:MAG: hypothetical protein A2571_00415 [Candidatus Vogelbacteria bacterium RIFOXYD1_FULL_44_32]
MFIDSSILKELLVSARVATRAELDVFEQEAKDKGLSLSERILVQGIISGDDLRRLEARASGVPFMSSFDDQIPYEVLAKIPEPVARAHNVIALRETASGLEVIGLRLEDILEAKNILADELHILPRLAPEALVRRLLLSYQRELGGRYGRDLRELGASLAHEKSERDLGRVANLVFRDASSAQARRILIEVSPSETLVRYRIGQKTYDAMATNPHIGQRLVESAGFPDLFKKYDFTPTGQFTTDLSKRAIFSRQSDNELAKLGLWGENLEVLENITAGGGLAVISGDMVETNKPLFYALAERLARTGHPVLSIEKKLERYLFHVEQVETAGKPVADILRRLLPHDFDAILVEEIDSPQTLALLAGAAGRGIAVFVGLSAKNLADLVSQTDQLLPDRYILSAVTKIFMRLEPVSTLGSRAVAGQLQPNEWKDLKGYLNFEKMKDNLVLAGLVDVSFDIATANFKVKKQNGDISLPDRTKIYATEALVVTLPIEKMIKDGKKPEEIVNFSREQGALKLNEDIFVLATLGKIDLNEAIALIRRHAHSRL